MAPQQPKKPTIITTAPTEMSAIPPNWRKANSDSAVSFLKLSSTSTQMPTPTSAHPMSYKVKHSPDTITVTDKRITHQDVIFSTVTTDNRAATVVVVVAIIVVVVLSSTLAAALQLVILLLVARQGSATSSRNRSNGSSSSGNGGVVV